MDNSIVLYGASGHCKVIIDILQSNNLEISHIIDDNPLAKRILDFEIVNADEFYFSHDFIYWK
jgi:Ethanolamine utilization protein EutJ (predicted chaperonin)